MGPFFGPPKFLKPGASPLLEGARTLPPLTRLTDTTRRRRKRTVLKGWRPESPVPGMAVQGWQPNQLPHVVTRPRFGSDEPGKSQRWLPPQRRLSLATLEVF